MQGLGVTRGLLGVYQQFRARCIAVSLAVDGQPLCDGPDWRAGSSRRAALCVCRLSLRGPSFALHPVGGKGCFDPDPIVTAGVVLDGDRRIIRGELADTRVPRGRRECTDRLKSQPDCYLVRDAIQMMLED